MVRPGRHCHIVDARVLRRIMELTGHIADLHFRLDNLTLLRFLRVLELFVVLIVEGLDFRRYLRTIQILPKQFLHFRLAESARRRVVNLDLVILFVSDDDQHIKIAQSPQLDRLLKQILFPLAFDIDSSGTLLNVPWQAASLSIHRY